MPAQPCSGLGVLLADVPTLMPLRLLPRSPLPPQAMASFQQYFFPEIYETNTAGETVTDPCE